MAFTAEHVEELEVQLERTKEKTAKMRKVTERAIGQSFQVFEVGATAFGLGYANAKWGEDGELSIAGFPLDLSLGIALTGVAMFGGLGKYADHGVNVGSGAMAAYSYRAGFQMGTESAADDTTDAPSAPAPSSSARKVSVAAARRQRVNGAAQQQLAVGWDGQAVTVHEKAT